MAAETSTSGIDTSDPPAVTRDAALTERLESAYAARGPDYVPRTEVWGSGAILDGVYKGDVYLRGLGDPFLDTDDLKGLVEEIMSGYDAP